MSRVDDCTDMDDLIRLAEKQETELATLRQQLAAAEAERDAAKRLEAYWEDCHRRLARMAETVGRRLVVAERVVAAAQTYMRTMMGVPDLQNALAAYDRAAKGGE